MFLIGATRSWKYFLQVFLSISNAGYLPKYAMLKNQPPQVSAENSSNSHISIITEMEVDIKHLYLSLFRFSSSSSQSNFSKYVKKESLLQFLHSQWVKCFCKYSTVSYNTAFPLGLYAHIPVLILHTWHDLIKIFTVSWCTFSSSKTLYRLVETIHILLSGEVTTSCYREIKTEDGCWEVLCSGEQEKGSGMSNSRSWWNGNWCC